MNYLQMQTIFQDKYETGLKNAGLEEYKLASETIFNYIHEAEVEVVDMLSRMKQFNYLKNFTTTSNIEIHEDSTIQNMYFATQPSDFMHYVKSSLTGTFKTFSGNVQGVVSNEQIEPNEAGMFYKTPYNSPMFRNPKVFVESRNVVDNKKIVVIVDSFTLPYSEGNGALSLTYIKRPSVPTPDGDSMIDVAYVNKVIELAVNAALSYVIAGGVTNSRERRQQEQQQQ
jgi:hypothetical protein